MFVIQIFFVSVKIYRDFAEGKQRQVQKLGAGKTVDGTINSILDIREGMEYQYLQ